VRRHDAWIESVPETWRVLRLGSIGTFSRGRGGSKEDNRDHGVPVVRYGELYTKFDNVIAEAHSFVDESDAPKYAVLPAGSIVFAGSGEDPAEIGKSALSRLEGLALVGGDTTVFKPSETVVDALYLAYALESPPLKTEKALRATGFTVVHIGVSGLKTLPVPLPPLGEQRAIAAYLDVATARIDMLIAKQREMIRLLDERKRAVPAGILGHIQVLAKRNGAVTLCAADDRWQSVPLRTMFDRKKDIGHPEEPMVSVFRERGVIFKGDAENLNKTAENRDIYQLVHPGWLLVNRMKAWQGSVGISGIRGITSGHYICFAPCHGADDRFLNALLRSPAYVAAYGMLSRGVRPGQIEIDNDLLGSLPVVLPPRTEQSAIASEIDDETAKIGALIAKTREHMALARERRNSLVTAAVTGQFDVHAASTRGVA